MLNREDQSVVLLTLPSWVAGGAWGFRKMRDVCHTGVRDDALFRARMESTLGQAGTQESWCGVYRGKVVFWTLPFSDLEA